MKKLLAGLVGYALATLGTQAQYLNNPCIEGSGTECLSAPYIVLFEITPDPLNVCQGQAAFACAAYGSVPGQVAVTTTNTSCLVTTVNSAVNATVLSNWWQVTIGAYSATGSGPCASFTPTVTGSGSLTFHMMYSIPASCGGGSQYLAETVPITVWGNGDSDYDGYSDCQEAKDGTDPYSPNTVTEMWLAYWSFNNTNWIGESGQVPLSATNLQALPGRAGGAVRVNNTPLSRLTYRELETNGWANINCRRGTIRFWFRPDWASTSLGGTGPQTNGRLVELGQEVTGSPTGRWALALNSAGTQLQFITQTNGGGQVNLTAGIAWPAGVWQQVVLTYSSTNSSLYVNGQPVVTNGLGVVHYPSAAIRANGFRVGSDQNGNNQAKGRFDDLESYNYPLSRQAIADAYARVTSLNSSNANDCVLRPITVPHSIFGTLPTNSSVTVTSWVSSGNFSWLRGDQKNADPKTLANELTNATGFAYIRSDSPSERVVSIGDWVNGDPGLQNSVHIREALDWLIFYQVPIILPVWGTHNNEGGSNRKYMVTNYARVILTAYTRQGNHSTLTMTYLGSSVCDTQTNRPPIVNAGPDLIVFLPGPAYLNGTVVDDGLINPVPTVNWQQISGPGGVFLANQNTTNATATFTSPGVYQFRLSAFDGGATGEDVAAVRVLQYPVVTITNPAPGTVFLEPANILIQASAFDFDGTVTNVDFYAGTTKIGNDTSSPFAITWPSVPAGIYALTARAFDNDGLMATSAVVVITVQAACSRTFTLNVDFESGTLVNVNYDFPNENQLQLNKRVTPFPYVNVACSARGTIVRIDANTGQILGEYSTAPANMSKNPSRTTVDKFGNVWVANRNESSGGQGSVTRVGLVIGGTRGYPTNGNGFVPHPNGEYLQPPFYYNTCVDRHGRTITDPPDGLIKTSRGRAHVLPWNNSTGVDSDGGVQTAEDEGIINYTRVTGTATRTIAIDVDNNVWAGGTGDQEHQKLSGVTGLPIPGLEFSPGCGAYGGLIDQKGFLWSVDGGSTAWRFDTKNLVGECITITNGCYGVGIDPATGNIWTSSGQNANRISQDGLTQDTFTNGVNGFTQGLAVDGDGNVWVTHSFGGTTVGHLRTDGTFVGNVQLPCLSGPTGAAVDANGKVWVANYAGHNAMRIDPNAGPIGGGGYRIGAVDLVVDLGDGSVPGESMAQPYNYSDMTGFVSIGATAPSGTWTVVHDSGVSNRWGNVGWSSSEPTGTGIKVEIRVAQNAADLANRTFRLVTNGVSFFADGLGGRFIEMRTTLTRLPEVRLSPILYDLTVTCGTNTPIPVENIDSMANEDNFSVVMNTVTNVLNVMVNDNVGGNTARIRSFTPARYGSLVIGSSGTNILYTPPRDFYGEDRFTYAVTNTQGAIGRAVVFVHVSRVNPSAPSPTAGNDSAVVLMNSIRNLIPVLTNDSPASVRIIAASDPPGGVADIDSCANAILYSPDPDFVGTDQFTYTIINTNGGIATATVTVVVTAEIPCDTQIVRTLRATDRFSRIKGPGFYADTNTITGSGSRVRITLQSSNFATCLFVLNSAGGLVASNENRVLVDLAAGQKYTIESTTKYPDKTGIYSLHVECSDAPELDVLFGTNMVNSNSVINYGLQTIGNRFTNTFTITNSGIGWLSVWWINVNGPNPGEFEVLQPQSFSVNSAATQPLKIVYAPTGSGRHVAIIEMYSNDADGGDGVESPFTFYVTGTANEPGTPPSVAITSPANNQSFNAPANVTVLTSVTPGSSALARVDFYESGSGPDPIASDNASPYTFTTNNLPVGTYTFRAVAVDVVGREGISAPVQISVVRSNTPPIARPDLAYFRANTASNVLVRLNDFDLEGDPLIITNVFPATRGNINWLAGYFQYTPTNNYTGRDSFRYTIADGRGGSNTATVELRIAPSGTLPAAPVAVLTTPPDNAEIYSLTNAIGTAQSTILDFYELQIRPFGDLNANWGRAFTGSNSVNNATLGALDPARYVNGYYEIRLVTTDLAGRTAETPPHLISILGDLKIGHFSVAFKEIEIPVAGIPISITRSYDSRRQAKGDFGVGWSLDIASIKLQKIGLMGDGWTAQGAGLLTYCLFDDGSHLVAIAMPDGKIHRFRPALRINYGGTCFSGFGASGADVQMAFDPLPGSFGQLIATDHPSTLIIDTTQFGFPGPVVLRDDEFEDIYDPQTFVYITRNGHRLSFDREGKLVSILDRNQNQLNISAGGILHSSGKSVRFIRDSEDRIKEIYDPIGLDEAGQPAGPPALKYEYDPVHGNLVAVHRLIDRDNLSYLTTSLTYTNAKYPNYLTGIRDPRGVVGIRNEYDEEGRIKATTDASGRSYTYTHDLNNKQERIVDRLGKTNIVNYDLRGNITSSINPLGQTNTFAYDANNNKTRETDPLGITSYFGYSDDGLPLSSTNALLEVSRFAYNDFAQVVSIADPRGAGFTNGYDGYGNLMAVTNPVGQVTSFKYDKAGNVERRTEPDGVATFQQHDENGYVTNMAVLDAQGATLTATRYAYDANGNRTNMQTSRTIPGVGVQTLTTTYIYDGANRLTKTIHPDGSSDLMVYNEIDLPQITVNQLQQTNRLFYDAHGRLTNVVYADNLFEVYAYDAEGRRTNHIDRAGRRTAFIFDALGRETHTIFPDQTTNRTVYDAAGRIAFIVDALGLTNAFGYDAAGRNTHRTNGLGTVLQKVSTVGFDAGGNAVAFTNELGRVVRNVYDDLSRLIEVRGPDGRTNKTVYGLNGQPVRKIDPAGIITAFGYDSLNRVSAVTNALGTPQQSIVRYSYDELGRLTNVLDALQRRTTFKYDAMGRRVEQKLPEGQIERFAYDALGNLIRHTNFNGVVITNRYDVINQLTNRSSANGFQVSYSYTPTGKRSTMSDGTGLHIYTYDERDRLKTNATPQGTLFYRYDANGSLTNVWSSSGGLNLRYQYDALHRLTNVLEAAGTSIAWYRYDPVGNLAGLGYPNGITNLYQYDAGNRLTNIVWRNGGGSALASFFYQLGSAGHRTNLNEIVNGTSRTFQWQFSPLYRLTREDIGGATSGTLTYGYDLVGNRTNRTVTGVSLANQAFAFSGNDWLSQDKYDNNGNTTNSSSVTYRYDVLNQLTNANNGQVVLRYDGDGNRVEKTVGGARTVYLVDGNSMSGYGQVVEEFTVTGGVTNLSKVYSYGLDLVRQRQIPSGITHYYGTDGQGSVRFLAGDSGTITDTYTYDAFGNTIASSGSTSNLYRYTGEQFDFELGFYYLRARYLNPNIGRFWTMDSYEGQLGDPLSLHRYLYAMADPVNRIDPSGHESLVSVMSGMGIANSLHAMYDGVVTAVGEALKATILGAAAGKSANEILTGFILDQTGIQTVIDVFELMKSFLMSFGADEEEALIVEFIKHFDFAVLPMLVEDEDYIDTELDEQGPETEADQPQCFAANTLVLTENGMKPIERVAIGDRVWAYDLLTGETVLKDVQSTYVRERENWLHLSIDDTAVQVTPEHPFYVRDKGWVQAGKLSMGDRLVTFDGEDDARVTDIKPLTGTILVYNFKVQDLHDYFVTEEGVLVHNRSWSPAFHHYITKALGSRIPYKHRIIQAAGTLKAWKHIRLHREMNKFLDAWPRKGGVSMRPGKGNPGSLIRSTYSPNERLKALCHFYRQYQGGAYFKNFQNELKAMIKPGGGGLDPNLFQ